VSRRALAAAVALAAVGQAACGDREAIRGGGVTIGPALTVYSALPGPGRGSSRDIAEGEKLALAEAQGRVGRYTISFSSLDQGGAGAAGRRAAGGQAARAAVADAQAAAVIGTLDSDAARAAIPLLNAAGLLHVSLGAGYPGFTGRYARDEPQRWFPAGGRTFARLVGDDRTQARALVRAAGTRRIAVEAEGGQDAAALASEVRRAAAAAGAKVVRRPGRDGAVIYAGEDPGAAARLAGAVARESPGARVILPDAVVRAGVKSRLGPRAARRSVFVSGAPEPGSTPALRHFEAAFERTFGRRPGPYAALGHAAMETVLDALRSAAADGRAGERRAVLRAYFAPGARQTVAGPISLDPAGQVAPARFTTFRLVRGRRVELPG
jgi:branched-chain amino acid transport system substrate-binding protein